MKIKATGFINKYRVKSLKTDTGSLNPLIFAAVSVLGICLGVLCETMNSDVYSTISVNYVDLLNKSADSAFLSTALKCTAYNSLYIFAAMIFGLCAVGNVFLYLIPFVKSLGVGAVCACIYSSYAIKGVLCCVAVIFPASLVQLIAIILSCSESRLMSREILELLDRKENENVKADTRLYILRYSVIFLFILISGIIYALSLRLLGGFST